MYRRMNSSYMLKLLSAILVDNRTLRCFHNDVASCEIKQVFQTDAIWTKRLLHEHQRFVHQDIVHLR